MKHRVNVGQNIRLARRDRHMTQQQLADKSGVTMVQISQIESGVSLPRFQTLEAIAEALDCAMSYLVREQWT